MTAGLNYDMQTPALQAYYEACGRRCPTVELVNEIAKAPLDFDPGTGWQYSLCHDVLAALVEVPSGQKFEIYVKEHIFDPLGMETSNFLHPILDLLPFLRSFTEHVMRIKLLKTLSRPTLCTNGWADVFIIMCRMSFRCFILKKSL